MSVYYKKLADALKCNDDEVIAVYEDLFKTTEDSRQINCCSCGFETCEQLVAAILLGLKSNESCVRYRQAEREKAEMQATTTPEEKLKVLNNQLEVVRNEQLKIEEHLHVIIELIKKMSF